MLRRHSLTSYIEVSASSFAANIATYKSLIGNAHLGLVIKGNAYGHGLNEMLTLTKNNPDINWYFTASLSEAFYIRAQGITKPILVMSIIDDDPLLAFKHNIRLIFHQREQFDDLERAHKHNLNPIIHLKVDTGLSRFGFLPHACADIVHTIKRLPHVILEGIFTHFAQAELKDQRYTDLQSAQFSSLVHELKHITPIPYIHSHATSATLLRGAEDTNMFRIGAGLYGLWPSHELQSQVSALHPISLTQVLTWKTHIINIRTIAAGTPIGYGCTYIAGHTMRIAQLPVGYADGYPRRLSNIGTTLVNNQYAPIIGRIGMNSITIDISNILNAHIGCEVILTGPQAGITALDLAHATGGFNPREVVTSIVCKDRIIVK